jgi:hypothetical protein
MTGVEKVGPDFYPRQHPNATQGRQALLPERSPLLQQVLGQPCLPSEAEPSKGRPQSRRSTKYATPPTGREANHSLPLRRKTDLLPRYKPRLRYQSKTEEGRRNAPFRRAQPRTVLINSCACGQNLEWCGTHLFTLNPKPYTVFTPPQPWSR